MKSKWLMATVTLALTLATIQPAFAAGEAAGAGNVFLEAVPASHSLHAGEVAISARSAAVIDVQTGRMLYEKNGDDQMLIASLTKIITAIVAIESGTDLNSVATVSNRAAGKEGSSIYLKVGEKQKLIDLLYAVMLRSGNDAATAVAEHVGKTEAKFVEMMNAKVTDLGLGGSHFANPSGLDAKGHYSTAHDMAVLTAYALRNPTFAEIVKTQMKEIPMDGESWNRRMYNKNKMLSRYEGADGVKTGYTKAAGRCLVSSATRNGRQIAVVTLDASSDWVDHQRLLDYGFQKYENLPFVEQNKTIKSLPVNDGVTPQVDAVVGQEFRYPVREDEKEKLRQEVVLPTTLQAPIVAGQHIGDLKIYFEDRLVGMVPIVAAQDVGSDSFFSKLKNLFRGMISH